MATLSQPELILAMFGPTEWLIIGGIVALLFGAKKLPQLARAMGSSITQFKQGMKESPEQLTNGDKVGDSTDES